jgi:hypothetical protein
MRNTRTVRGVTDLSHHGQGQVLGRLHGEAGIPLFPKRLETVESHPKIELCQEGGFTGVRMKLQTHGTRDHPPGCVRFVSGSDAPHLESAEGAFHDISEPTTEEPFAAALDTPKQGGTSHPLLVGRNVREHAHEKLFHPGAIRISKRPTDTFPNEGNQARTLQCRVETLIREVEPVEREVVIQTHEVFRGSGGPPTNPKEVQKDGDEKPDGPDPSRLGNEEHVEIAPFSYDFPRE